MSAPFPNVVTVTTADGRTFDEYNCALEYLRHVVDLPKTILAFANDDKEMERYPEGLLFAPVNRELQFREGLHPDEPLGQDGFGTNKVPENFMSLLVFVSGVEPAGGCKAECSNKFAYCVVPRLDIDYEDYKLSQRSLGCANCHYNGSATRCPFEINRVASDTEEEDFDAMMDEEEEELGEVPVDDEKDRDYVDGHDDGMYY